MGINARTVPVSTTKRETLAPGTYPARLVQVIDLGLQPQPAYKGEAKPNAYELAMTYEFVDEFMKDEDGQEMKDKPRWLTETIKLYSLEADKAKSTLRYKALDPNEVHNGDFGALVDTPCNVTIVINPGKGKNAGKTFENIESVSPMREKDAKKCPALVNGTRIFDLDDPDMEVFASLPKYLQDKIKNNLQFAGSKLEKELGGTSQPGPVKQEDTSPEDDVNDEDVPY